MSGPLRIRPAADIPGDLETITDFQLRMARETEGLELDPGTVIRGVAAVLADPAKGSYWVAERDGGIGAIGAIVGSLLTTFEWSDWRNGTVLWIQSVYVVPGLKGLRLYVDKRNAAAQEVYERLGMTREHYELFEWLK